MWWELTPETYLVTLYLLLIDNHAHNYTNLLTSNMEPTHTVVDRILSIFIWHWLTKSVDHLMIVDLTE